MHHRQGSIYEIKHHDDKQKIFLKRSKTLQKKMHAFVQISSLLLFIGPFILKTAFKLRYTFRLS